MTIAHMDPTQYHNYPCTHYRNIIFVETAYKSNVYDVPLDVGIFTHQNFQRVNQKNQSHILG